MKVKVRKQETIIKEIDLEYPIYLYFQDEDCNDEIVMVNENMKVTVKFDIFGIEVTSSNFNIIEEYELKNQTTREHFMESYKEALKHFSKIIEM